MATIDDHIKATEDPHFQKRVAAAAGRKGIQLPNDWVKQNINTLASVEVSPDNTAASLLAYGRSKETLPAGADPQYITDEYLDIIVDKTIAATTVTPSAPDEVDA